MAASSASGWRSEEDWVLGRLAVALGLLDPATIARALERQGAALAAGQALSLGQVLLREGLLAPGAVVQLQGELARLLRACPRCGQRRYLAPGPQPRNEPCTACGGPIPVPAADSGLSASTVGRREEAFARGTARFRNDPFVPKEEAGAPVARAFGAWVIEAELGRGGMGAVYRARHQQTGQAAALKVVLAGSKATDAQVHRFKREAKAQLELDHPGIVKIFEAGEWEGVLYYAMELVPGSDLSKLAPKLELKERVSILARVARAVHHAHAAGYVHRDLKPQNVLLDEGRAPKVTDFGLAKNLGGETKLTNEGQVLGTPYYMAPEQATGQTAAIDPRTDVWALGVVLYELATGKLPFVAEASLELYQRIVEAPPPPFAQHGVLEPVLEQIAFKAVQKDPHDRYATADDLAVDLERWGRGEAPLGQQTTGASRAMRQVARHQRSIGVVLLFALGGLVLLLALVVGIRRALKGHLAERDRVAWTEGAARSSTALRQALSAVGPDDDDASARAKADLDAALGAAREHLGAAPPGAATSDLAGELVPALLRRAHLGLAERTASGARRALECADEAQQLGAPRTAHASSLTSLPAPAPGAAGDPLVGETGPGETGPPDEAELEVAIAARSVAGLAHVRLGALDAARVAAGSARATARVASLRLPLLDGAIALAAFEAGSHDELERGALKGALEATLPDLEAATGDRALAGPALATLARALLRLGREADARAALARLEQTPPRAGHRRAAEAWLACARPVEAAAALQAAHALEPGHARTARRLARLLLDLGRPHEALRALDASARAGASELEALRLEARAHLGLTADVLADAAALGSRVRAAPIDQAGELRLALEDLRRASAASGVALATAVEPEAPREDPWTALRAVALARASGGAPAWDAPLAAAVERAAADLPRDAPPSPEQARLARDLGWVRLAARDFAGAARLAEDALRGLPGDVDATLLLVRAGAAPPARLHAALRASCGALDGPLGRGLLLARAASWLRRPALAREAGPCLEAALVRAPSLDRLVAVELARLAPVARAARTPVTGARLPPGAAAAPGAPDQDALDAEVDAALAAHRLSPEEDALLGPGLPPRREPARTTPAARAESGALLDEAIVLPREEDRRSIALLERALAIDPGNLTARAEHATRVERDPEREALLGGELPWMEFGAASPGTTWEQVMRLRREWQDHFNYSELLPTQEADDMLAAGPDDPHRQLLWVIERYVGLLFPLEDRPAFSKADPALVLARLDAAIALDPRMVGYLYVRAHLHALAGRADEARRDLRHAHQGAQESVARDGPLTPWWDIAYRAWVLASLDTNEALAVLVTIDRDFQCGKKQAQRLIEWLAQDPRLDPLRASPAFRKLQAEFQPR